ncbi:hypothetical protein WN944_014709 [Citrus x changshan-huyou]|uniref:Uncharacterized protein n=1 Tax=Citrus x changshan-huyou TaxID=2935761 RepID=A0AAP0QIZ0_9ROSI
MLRLVIQCGFVPFCSYAVCINIKGLFFKMAFGQLPTKLYFLKEERKIYQNV